MADATTVYTETYDVHFTKEEHKRLVEYFESRTDIKGNFKYRMFNKFEAFKDAITEHTDIVLSRVHHNTITTITVDFMLRDGFTVPHFTTVKFGTPAMNDIESYTDPYPTMESKIPNIVIMAIVEAEGNKHTKRYEACIFNPEFDLVNDSIRFVDVR